MGRNTFVYLSSRFTPSQGLFQVRAWEEEDRTWLCRCVLVRTNVHKISASDLLLSRLTGRKYFDTINILGLMFAGYIPQLFSTIFDNTSVVWDLMLKSGASCLIYDEEFADRAALCTLPTLRAYVQDSGPTDEEPRHGSIPHPSALETDTAFIIHSSGTTSGMPKLIPVSHGWLNNFVTIKYPGTLKQGNYDDRNITNTLGSLAHVGSITGGYSCLSTWI